MFLLWKLYNKCAAKIDGQKCSDKSFYWKECERFIVKNLKHDKTWRHRRHVSGTIRINVRNHQDDCQAKRGKISKIYPQFTFKKKKIKIASKYLVASQLWGCLTTLRLPQKCDAASEVWGCLTSVRLPPKYEASSQVWGFLASVRLPRKCEASLQVWGFLISVRLPCKCETS